MEVTNNNHEKAGDNTDVNIQNSNCFARCKKNLISLKAEEIVLLKELTTGEIITVIKRIKSVEETQSRDEVKHLIEENSSKTAIIKILSENINHHITHSSNTSNSFIQQNDFTQTPKYPYDAPFRLPKKPVKSTKSRIIENDIDIVSPNRFESLKSDTSSSCFQNKTDNTLLFPKPVIQESVKPRMEKSNIKTFGKNLKNNRRPTICTTEQHLQNYAPHQKTVPGKDSYANIVNSNKEKVCIIGDSHLKRINKRKLKYNVGKMVSFKCFSGANTKKLDYCVVPTLVDETPQTVVIHIGSNDITESKIKQIN